MGASSQLYSPAALLPGKIVGTHCMGGWVSPGVGLDGCGNYLFHQDAIPGSSSPQRVTIRTELSQPTIMAYISTYSLWHSMDVSAVLYCYRLFEVEIIRYPMNRRLGGFQSLSGGSCKRNIFFHNVLPIFLSHCVSITSTSVL